MALTIHFYLLLFTFTTSSVKCEYANLESYTPLITQIRASYGISSVYFISTNINQHMQEYVLLHTLSHKFSQLAVRTLVLQSNMLEERFRIWRGKLSRPLIVAMLTTPDEVTDLIVNTRGMDMSNPLWLLIFDDEDNEIMCEYCNKPIENIFHLSFDTEMLVSCCRDPMIKEWWALRENKTEMADFARWTEEEGLKLLTSKGLYERCHDINGTALRVTYIDYSLIHGRIGPYKFEGFYYDFFKELQRAMKFEIAISIKETVSGTWNSTTKRWTGAISHVVEGNADIGIGPFAMSRHRLDAVDFSFPLFVAETKLYIKEPDGLGVEWFAYFKAFEREVWVTIIVLMIATSALLTIIKMKAGSESLPYLFFGNFIRVWGIFCQQALDKFPAETSLRIAYFSIFVSALVISSTYSASFISFLTVSTINLPFSNIEGFIKDGSYKLTVIRDSADYEILTESTDPVTIQMKKLLRPWHDLPLSMAEGFQQVCQGNVAFHTNEALARLARGHLPCKMIRIDTGRISNYGLILPHQSQYTDVINYHIQRFQDNGMMHRWKTKYLIKKNPAVTSHPVVTVRGITPIFLILAGGMILAFVILFGEKLYVSCTNLARESRRSRLRNINTQSESRFNVIEEQRIPQKNSQFRLKPRTQRLNHLHPPCDSWNVHSSVHPHPMNSRCLPNDRK